MEALVNHGEHDLVLAFEGCRAIYHLSIASEDCMSHLGLAGACERVIDILKLWGQNFAVAEQVNHIELIFRYSSFSQLMSIIWDS